MTIFRRFLLSLLIISFDSIVNMAYSYPVKLLHMEYRDEHYYKHVFFIGDIHCQQREKSPGGLQAIKQSNWFFDSIELVNKHHQKTPIIWEISVKSSLYSNSPLYLHKQAISLASKSKPSKIILTPSDNLRKQSSVLRKLMFLAINKPGIAKSQLNNPQFRRRVLKSLEKTFLAKTGNTLEKKFYQANKHRKLPPQISAVLKQNLRWHRQQLVRLKENLSYPPNKIVAENLVEEVKENLSKATADLEFFVNIFSHDSHIVLVYAGNGHVKRLQKFFYKLGFKTSFEIENGDFLSRHDFRAFANEFKKCSTLSIKTLPNQQFNSPPYLAI